MFDDNQEEPAKDDNAWQAIPWVSVLIPTWNEALHIERAIRSAKLLSPHVYVVDSCSIDGTAQLARELGAVVLSGKFENLADKLNWSMENIDFPTPWICRLDADEVFTAELLSALPDEVKKAASNVSGFFVRRQFWFMKRWIKYGGMYPAYSMRLWRKGLVTAEVRNLDEHMILHEGVSERLNLDIIDNALTDLACWIEKHNRYASLEVAQVFDGSDDAGVIHPKLLGSRIERVRWLKSKVFYRLPLFIRPMMYFFYRYIVRLGFLDGREGFLYHFMHALWYRILVDAKIYERKKLM